MLNFNFPASEPESLISAEVPTDPGGKPITKIEGNEILLTFPQPSDIYGPVRYVKISNDMSFGYKLRKQFYAQRKNGGREW